MIPTTTMTMTKAAATMVLTKVRGCGLHLSVTSDRIGSINQLVTRRVCQRDALSLALPAVRSGHTADGVGGRGVYHNSLG